MPPLPSPGNVIKVDFQSTNEGANFVNLFYLGYTGTHPSSSDLSTIAGYLETNGLIAAYEDSTVASFDITGVTYTDLSSSTGSIYSHIPAHTSTLTGDVVSANNAVVVSCEIARRYRGGHPRKYMPFGSSTVLAGSSTINWQAAFLTNVQNDFNTLHSAFPHVFPNQTITGFVNVSYYDAGARRVTPVVDPITSFVVRERVCSQRRRLGKVGG